MIFFYSENMNTSSICVATVYPQMASRAKFPTILARGTGHFVTMSNLDGFEALRNKEKLNRRSSPRDKLEERNPCQ
jgi:hypothetical protein